MVKTIDRSVGESSRGFSVTYDAKTDRYYVRKDGRRRRIKVNRYEGSYFDENGRFHRGELVGVR